MEKRIILNVYLVTAQAVSNKEGVLWHQYIQPSGSNFIISKLQFLRQCQLSGCWTLLRMLKCTEFSLAGRRRNDGAVSFR